MIMTSLLKRLACLSFLLLCVPTLFTGLTRAAEKPNVVLVMADDMGMGDTSAFQDFTGNADSVQVHTPNMERLARMGVRFTDAHTPSSRCSPTRYGLLTGRYPWRNRLKHWVLFGSQGDPMIEPGRPTLATLFKDSGYTTAMFGKWHVGLRYSRSDGSPADGWDDADLRQPLHTSPLDHGFDVCRFTSRSHKTSGPDAKPINTGNSNRGRNPTSVNQPNQNIGPGHIDGRRVIAATENGKQLIASGPHAYVLNKLGSRHSDAAIEFLNGHLTGHESSQNPFFIYYPSNSNHSPYTPDEAIDGVPVAGASRTIAGAAMDARHDFVYENDVALGRLIDYLEQHDDPRNPGHKLIENTIVIFTSDNGAEKNSNIATGPFRSHKGSTYEGGHRVPFIVAWAKGGVGDGKASTPGTSNATPIGLTDLFATFADVIHSPLPDLRSGEKGGEDSTSVLAAWRGEHLPSRPPMFFHDHKEAKGDPAVSAMRLDGPTVGEITYPGQWKLFFDASLLRAGQAHPIELYDLKTDPQETHNRLSDTNLAPLVHHLCEVALLHRNSGGHRTASIAPAERMVISFQAGTIAQNLSGKPTTEGTFHADLPSTQAPIRITLSAYQADQCLDNAHFTTGRLGLGIGGGMGKFDAVDSGESLRVSFDHDVLIESVALVAGKGACGGFYQVGQHQPLAIYCVDAANDAKDQSGILSDIGVLKAGQELRLDSSPHYGVDPPGQWRLRSIIIRPFLN